MPDSAINTSLTAETLPAALAMDLVSVTEAAAIAAASGVGRGDERRAHELAALAMQQRLSDLGLHGHIAIGDDDASAELLRSGVTIGAAEDSGRRVDIVLDPLEGATLTAKAMNGAMSVIAAARGGSVRQLPRVYMDKVAIGPGYQAGTVDLNRSAADNVRALAGAKGVSSDAIVVCVLDRPRNARLIAELREVGARVRMISDGDIAGVINVAQPEAGVDMYLGSGGAAEGVLAAAALKCSGGFFEGRLALRTDDERRQAAELGLDNPDRVFGLEDLIAGPVIFAATGVTGGALLDGVERRAGSISAHSLVMNSGLGLVRRIRTERRV